MQETANTEWATTTNKRYQLNSFSSFCQNYVNYFARLIKQQQWRYTAMFDYSPVVSCPQANIWQREPPAGSICPPPYPWQIYTDISRANLKSLIVRGYISTCNCVRLFCPCPCIKQTVTARTDCGFTPSRSRWEEIRPFHFSLIMVLGEGRAY